jgi:pimeloyl-ACP methyl ester carboxylesterase
MASFRHAGGRIAYTEYGSGARTVVLVHGLLLSQRMHERLARALAQRGNHVLTIDLLGHGLSDRPDDPACYSTAIFAEQVVALLDHLAIDEAIVLGTSLGANTALEVAALAPDRVRGMVVEMPVLARAPDGRDRPLPRRGLEAGAPRRWPPTHGRGVLMRAPARTI